ncbi:MAG: PspA/IM30 family protein [Thermoproteota archaeon]|nr:PspA/IM30 family protein [Thermoproteota archaeon]
MGLMNRITTVISQKANTLLDRFEKPQEALDYSYVKQVEMLNKLRRSLAEITTSRKRLEMQKSRLWENIRLLDAQASRALEAEREDLARLALERKNANLLQTQNLDKQIGEMKQEEANMQEAEKRMSIKVEEFKAKKEIIKAQYSAAEAQVRIKESVTGISEEMTDVGISMSRAEEKTERLRAKSQALDEMINSGVLTDYTSNKDEIEKELEKITVQNSVEEELAKLKSEKQRKKKQQLEQEVQQ